MKNDFPEFYAPSRDELSELYRTGTVALDSNVLLSLYEVGRTERLEVLDVLETVKARLWIPHQVGLEYQRNRLRVIREQASVYSTVRGKFTRAANDARKAVEDVGAGNELRKEIASAVEVSIASLSKELDRLQSLHGLTVSKAISEDPIRVRLDDLLDGKVGSPPSEKELKKRTETGLARIEERVPPGYMDTGKGDDDRTVGDYLIWAELLNRASSASTPLLFITGDVKEDWYQKVGDWTVGPRVELVREMRAVASQAYHQQSLPQFLKFAQEVLNSDVADSTIEQVEAANDRRLQRERSQQNVRHFLAASAVASESRRSFLDELDEESRQRILGPALAHYSLFDQLDEEAREQILGPAIRHYSLFDQLDEEAREQILGPAIRSYPGFDQLDEKSQAAIFGLRSDTTAGREWSEPAADEGDDEDVSGESDRQP